MNNRKIIGLMGAKGSGKDTSASFLIQERGYRRTSFATELYRQAAAAYGVSVEYLGDRTLVQTPNGPVEFKEHPQDGLKLQRCTDPAFVQCVLEELQATGITVETPLSPRVVMQLWGTEYRRKRGVDSYWLDIVGAELRENPEVNFVITDVRFPNEHAFVKAHCGYNWRVRNLEVEQREAANRARNGSSAHPSETEAAKLPAVVTLYNVNGDLAGLRAQVLAGEHSMLEVEAA